MGRCRICKEKFKPKYHFLEKTCSDICKKIFEKEAPKRAIKKVSDKRKVQEVTYKLLRKQYLTALPNCQVCGNLATEIHHRNGREGERLYDQTYFMSICRKCHTFLHEHPKESREKGHLI